MKNAATRREPRPPSATEFEAAVERHRAEIVSYLLRIIGNRDDAEDACHDALLRACRASDRLQHTANLRAWLYKIATRVAFDVLKRRRRIVSRQADVDLDSLPAITTPHGDRADLRRVVRAVQMLPIKQRAALMQRQFDDLSYDEIALSLGCTPAAARANVYQAIKRLRRILVTSGEAT